ncbi:MAG: response regulator transcription factor [Rhodospirillaceae bacterium]|jgi:DNA-binding response OmpR family regulator|nr:response regulator transcription factor [Rhodospirillaceae bacterium]MBT5083512.1 response regulator transcription factor [Rhodospirillaceae bacterium]MBT5527217.1 response regulator transcription factor [Rhodospirillaceae bacterium]MBT5879942.1 response regulator transcription factor [Rhodospirillaceae bacterium]MBT6589569.1 response regulator transcription factor [Rhodospirillaceae bacterium]
MRLLLVEDEIRLADVIAGGLSRAGFTVDEVASMGDADAALSVTQYDALILDLGLPDGDGMTLLRDLRRGGNATPVLILTARDGLDDRVEGLNAGADDYLLKPFAMPELVARLKALLRRPSGALGVHLEIGNIRFDTISREVEIATQPITLTGRELSLLEHLMRRSERVVAKDVLEDHIYGFGEETASNSLEVMVHRLRRKLVDCGATAHVHTVRGVGYLLKDNPP